MKGLALAPALALALVPLASADPYVCHETDVSYVCAGGEVQGDCATQGYRYDEVLVSSVAGFVFVRGDSLCSNEGTPYAYEDSMIDAGAGTDVLVVRSSWYRFSSHDPDNGDFEGCRMLHRAYTPLGNVFYNTECYAGDPPDPGWGEVLP